MAFRGTYHHTLDAKHRLTVPSRFRDDFEDGVIAVKGVDACVELWRPADYDAHVDAATENMGAMTPDLRLTLRLLQGSAHEAALDKVGRIGIPAGHLAHAQADRDVVLVGTGRCLEMWDRARWERAEAELAVQVAALTAGPSHGQAGGGA